MPRYLCLWSQHRLKDRELAAFCAPEIDNALQATGQPASEPYTCERDLAEPAQISAYDLRWIPAPDEQQLLSIASMCTLLDSVAEVWDVCSDTEQACACLVDRCVSPHSSAGNACWSLRLLASSRKQEAALAVQIMARAAQADVCIKHAHLPAAQQLCCIELHSNGRCLIGRVVVTPDRSAHAALSAVPPGPASMDPDRALLTIHLAGISRGSVVLDPCAGSGRLLAAAAHVGAALVLGMDIIPFPDDCTRSSLRDMDMARGNIHHMTFRGASFDAVVTDPPYGRRVSIENGPQEGADGFLGVLRSLLRLASSALVPGGRLSCWLPLMDFWLTHKPQGCSVLDGIAAWLQQEPTGQQLQLMHLIPEQRSGPGISRALAVLIKSGASPAFHAKGHRSTSCHGSQAPHIQAQFASDTPDRTGAYSISRQQGTVDIWRAAWMGDTASIERYIAAGGAADALDAKGCTPLLMAAGYGRCAAVSRLLQAGASSAVCPAGTSPLHRAAARGHTEVCAVLLQHCAEDALMLDASGSTPLHQACQFGHVAAAECILGAADGLARQAELVKAADKEGLTALHCACRWGHVQVMKLLLRTAHADLAQRSSATGLTPLHLAARWGHAAALKLLLGASSCALEWQDRSHAGASAQRGPGSRPMQALHGPHHDGPHAHDCSDTCKGPALRRQAPQPDAQLTSCADGCRTTTELGIIDLHDARLALLMSRTAAGRTALEEAEHWSRGACVALLKRHMKSLMLCT